jgi:hypothetical protein
VVAEREPENPLVRRFSDGGDLAGRLHAGAVAELRGDCVELLAGGGFVDAVEQRGVGVHERLNAAARFQHSFLLSCHEISIEKLSTAIELRVNRVELVGDPVVMPCFCLVE